MDATEVLFKIIKKKTNQKEIDWIQTTSNGNLKSLQTAFVATPRFIKDAIIDDNEIVNEVSFFKCSLVKLVRIFFLISIKNCEKEEYLKTINTLFETAENNEAVSLVSALPFIKYPESLILHATNAVRSNIGVVFDAIAFQNPYPKLYFSELAWNQMVLKCLFNDKPIQKINGITERANKELAYSISNLAHERWAANRSIPTQSWRLVSKFVDETIFEDIKKLFLSENINDQIAAALVCNSSDYEAAKIELQKNTKLKENIQNFSWESVT